MVPAAACARRPVAFSGPPVAATAIPAFDILSLFDKGRAERIIEERFNDVTKKVEATTGIPAAVQTQLYGLFKQAVVGNATGSGPGLFGNKKNWEAWVQNMDLTKVQAMQKYINLALQFVEKM